MEDWSKGKVEESFPWWLFHRKRNIHRDLFLFSYA
jgi:hypothetical protein